MSDAICNIEHMFDDGSVAMLVARIGAAARAENRAAGERLAAIGELDLLRLRQVGERETWCTDTQEAITAEVAAALGITQGLATSYLEYSRAMRLRLPRVGALLLAGDIDYRSFQTIVYRTDLITDPDVLAAVDAELAVKVARWPGITQGRLGGYVDRVVARADRDAVRRRRERRGDREFSIWGDADGLTEVFGRLITTDAHAVDARLDALAATVCDGRSAHPQPAPRRRDGGVGRRRRQARMSLRTAAMPRRSDTGAVSGGDPCGRRRSRRGRHGADAGLDDRQRRTHPRRSDRRARTFGGELRPLMHPTDAPPETGYTPSRSLADFVRCRDLTCRFPGCDKPAMRCDLDHTIPYR